MEYCAVSDVSDSDLYELAQLITSRKFVLVRNWFSKLIA